MTARVPQSRFSAQSLTAFPTLFAGAGMASESETRLFSLSLECKRQRAPPRPMHHLAQGFTKNHGAAGWVFAGHRHAGLAGPAGQADQGQARGRPALSVGRPALTAPATVRLEEGPGDGLAPKTMGGCVRPVRKREADNYPNPQITDWPKRRLLIRGKCWVDGLPNCSGALLSSWSSAPLRICAIARNGK